MGHKRLPREFSREEREAEVRQAAIENRVPFDSYPDVPPSSAAPSAGPIDPEAFTAADLTGLLLSVSEPYLVPKSGKRLWVHPLSTADRLLLTQWSLERQAPEPDEQAPQQRVGIAAHRAAEEAKVFAVILACRVGPDKTSRRCFGKQDFHGVSSYLGCAVVDEIVQIAQRLSGNEEVLTPAARRFFACIRSWLGICSGALSTWGKCPTGLVPATERLASLVSSALSSGTLTDPLIESMEECLILE